MGFARMTPLLVVEDVVVGQSGVTLLPAVARDGLPLCAGDAVDVVHDDERDEVTLLALDPDRDPTRVRLRLASGTPIAPGFEIWPSQTQSHVTIKRSDLGPGEQVVSLAGAVRRRQSM
ncbi:MAG: hypothetical protein E8A46_27570 [Bradyrhizobium sp.]|uniref:hypothetical protein n=1 Tax=Bradyrhizobium sp. TaxID=376 RepID=UPI0012287A3C|nr:hypothetical protein [Bradyrhizobium sp.]THD46084.1 MAG: hypothetical protein E8A46_27570 [Bradyrhizobium sp.]